MSEIQHAGAMQLLGIITRIGAHSGKLTYTSAAKLMRPRDYEKHSRAVAQMCDLLDAAACLAGVPLLALVAVRAKTGRSIRKLGPKSTVRRGVQSSIVRSPTVSLKRTSKPSGKR